MRRAGATLNAGRLLDIGLGDTESIAGPTHRHG
jgi:hypothetical protein